MSRSPFRRLLSTLSPRRWRWERFLRALPLDPDALARPLAEPGPRDVLICGVPRSGTTLLTAMLRQPPHALTVMEPWDGMRLAPEALFRSLRDEIATGTLRRGKLDAGALRESGRVKWAQEGETPFAVPPLDDDYVLGVKWPVYTRFLGLLSSAKFLVCVRDPFEVVASFKKQTGGLHTGLMYDTRFNRELRQRLLAATDDDALRRVLLYSTMTERMLPHLDADNVFVVRYERWFSDPDALMGEISDFLGVPLPERPATLRASGAVKGLDARDVELIREHAGVAERLGYSLDREVAVQ